MQVNSMLKATTAALALILTASASQAATRTWDGDVSTNANVAQNWSGDTLPTSSDQAVIPLPANNRLPVLSANLSVGSLNVQANASITTGVHTLTVANSGGLDVDASGTIVVSRPSTGGTLQTSGGGTHQIDGLIDVRGFMLIDSNNATFQGSGSIKLNNASASMDISSGLTVTGKMLFEGQGQIRRVGGSAATTFVLYADATYSGIIDANVNGSALAFASGITLDDTAVSTGVPLYRAQNGGRLEFNQNATGLVGDVEILDCSTIDVNVNDFESSGNFDWHGTVEVDSGGSFDMAGEFFESTQTSEDC